MPLIRFVNEQGEMLEEVEAQQGDAILDLARLLDAPLHWRCGQGTCGTCKVMVTPEPCFPVLGNKERNVLLRAGLGEPVLNAEQQVVSVGGWRLACHLHVPEVDCQVVCPVFSD